MSEIQRAIAFDQPKLAAIHGGRGYLIKGEFLLYDDSSDVHPSGPITSYEIRAIVPDQFPRREPQVFETGSRIPRNPDRHVNHDGSCCVTVWEDWLAREGDKSFYGYVNGPLREFFFSQYYFETRGRWPFGERSHYAKGLLEAYAEALGIPCKEAKVIYHLRLLSKQWPKGHWACPCGSGKKLRYCHRNELWALHEKVPPWLAKRMLIRLQEQLDSRRKDKPRGNQRR